MLMQQTTPPESDDDNLFIKQPNKAETILYLKTEERKLNMYKLLAKDG